MKKPDLKATVKAIQAGAKKHSPEILVGVGIAGMITTTVLAVKATPKAITLLEEKKKAEHAEKLPVVETVKTAWKCYIPAAVTGSVSVACLVGANSVSMRRNAALAAAYTISESTLKEYREKVVETIGEKKEQTVRDAVAKEQLESHPVTNSTEVIITERGNTLCFDVFSGRYFNSDMDKIKKAVNELNYRMMSEMYISLNDYYYELGLPALHPLGEDLGWNINDGQIEVSFTSEIATDGHPCLVVNYNYYAPRYDYRTLS